MKFFFSIGYRLKQNVEWFGFFIFHGKQKITKCLMQKYFCFCCIKDLLYPLRCIVFNEQYFLFVGHMLCFLLNFFRREFV
jgi:hypothetical protein